jgi:RNA polymerase sigma-70 factor (ECF subfamily)
MDTRLSRTDAALLARLLAGEKPAFEELVRTHHGPMKRAAAAIVGEAQAEDVVQEAWIAAIKNLPKFEGRSSLKTWLFSIVINGAKGRLRKHKREVLMGDLSTADGPFAHNRFLNDGHWSGAPSQWHVDSAEALLSHEDFRHCLEKTLAGLPEIQRSVLTLRDYQGLELADICNILEISASNIRVLLHRARAKVYLMAEHFEETGKC